MCPLIFFEKISKNILTHLLMHDILKMFKGTLKNLLTIKNWRKPYEKRNCICNEE